MIRYIRKSRFAKVISLTLAISLVSEVVFPTVAIALTGGPSQPEVESFAPIEATDMVDLFSGDFKYNIPLLEVDGYPVNLSYNSNITMDQEASWVGLGWNLNPGVINRSMRGLPDEFSGDKVTKEFNLKENDTYGLRVYLRPEFFSKNLELLSLGYTMTYSTKNGFNVETNLGISTTLAKVGAGKLNVGLNFNSSTYDGFNFNPSVSFDAQVGENEKQHTTGGLGVKIGFPVNSLGGLRAMQLGLSAKESCYDVKLDRKTSYSMDASSSISFVPNTYTPQISVPIANTSYDVNLNIGCNVKISDAFAAIGGFYLGQKVRNSTIVKSAYGYINNSEGIKSDDVLLDFNREKDVVYHPEIKNLPVTNRTYDIYSVQGQGVGGTFRSYNNDNSYVFDDYNQNTSTAFNAGLELAFTDIVKGGIDLTYNNTYTNSNVWMSQNSFINYYKRSKSNNLLYEKSHFKMVGESNIESDETFLTNTGFKNATRLELNQTGGLDVALSNRYVTKYNGSFSNPASEKRRARQKRNQYIGVLSAQEASSFGLEKSIYSYFKNVFSGSIIKSNIERNNVAGSGFSGNVKKHPSEVSILQSDGTRYVYGIPAYVTKQVEACFSVNPISQTSLPLNCQTHYDAGDPTPANTKGYDNYLSKTTLPPYAHSYLLTAQLSPDYIDLSGDGPTDDDMGNFTKFNYTSMFATTGEYYKWRTPFEENEASYNEGMRSVEGDEKGNYVYGEKDIWYLHSIETKNYIVEFELENRADGYGVKGENGGRNNVNLLQRLKKITLYSKKDRIKNGQSAVPIKTVHFEYDYSLCQGVPNNANPGPNDKGKLTLKKVYFTYENSYKGKLNAYTFSYNENVQVSGTRIFNPNYDVKGYDRWGFYKPSRTNQLTPGSMINAYEFPYVDQRDINPNWASYGEYNTDVYAAAWSLSEIKTPSGATIKIKYESDDYAYVQDKRAMQMLKIEGFSNTTSLNPVKNVLYGSAPPQLYNYFNYLFVSIPEAVGGKEEIKNKYLDGVDQLYFKCLTNMTEDGNHKEYISGYAKIKDYGVVSSNLIWILIDDFNREDENPVSVASWRFCMDNARHFIDNTNPPGQGASPAQVLKNIAGMGILEGLINTINGPWETARSKSIGKTVDLNFSWVRLQNPDGHKLGGGARVREINIEDNWNEPAMQTYGQTYDYIIQENFAGSSAPVSISSGVAAYEPMSGSDEIPHHTAVFYKTSGGFMRPDNYGSLEMPMGESFFPAPTVGYRQVTVKSLSNSEVINHGTGKVVHEFYTAKDFPVKCNDVTDLQAIPLKSGWFENLFAPNKYNKMFVSQGYLIEINDMHGKPKSKKVYAEGNNTNPVSGEEYIYKLRGKDLDNTVQTINRSGSISNRMVNVDYDIVNDFRESITDATQSGSQINLTFFVAGIAPIILPPVWSTFTRDNVSFRSSVTTKVINYYGVLQDVIKFDQSSRVMTSNQLYDSESGEVLLTKTQNAFKDSLYTFKYPAHWAYPGMWPAYENTGLEFTPGSPLTISNGTLNLTSSLYPANPQVVNQSARELFSSGDELSVLCTYTGSTVKQTIKAWVLDLNTTRVTLVDYNGQKLPDGMSVYSVKVMNSGHKNQHTQPIASVVSRKSPLPYLATNSLQNAQILESEAIEYDNVRKVYCGAPVLECKVEETRECSDFYILLNYILLNNKLVFNSSPVSGLYFSEPVSIFGNQLYNHYFTDNLKSKLIPQSGGSGNLYLVAAKAASTPSTDWHFCITTNYTMAQSFILQQRNWSNPSVLPVFGLPVIMARVSDLDLSKVKQFVARNWVKEADYECEESTLYAYKANYIDTSNIYHAQNMIHAGFLIQDFDGAYVKAVNKILYPSYTNCGIGPGSVVNPYTYGILGNWTPRKSYKYLAERMRTEAGGQTTDIRQDGNYKTFNPFWEFPGPSSYWSKTANTANWQWTNMIAQKDRNGTEIENVNALNIYSAALFGSAGNLPLAVAANARHKEIFFDGFEELQNDLPGSYIGSYTPDCQKHFQYYPQLILNSGSSVSVSQDRSHSGKYSMKLNGNSDVGIYTDLEEQTGKHFITIAKEDCNSRWSEEVLPVKDESLLSQLQMNQQECLVKFSPDTVKKYIVSYWVSAQNNSFITDQSLLPVKLEFVDQDNSSVVLVDINQTIGKPIEGWQRVEVSFTLGASWLNHRVLLKIKNTDAGNAYYLDDLRILPQNSAMKTYVYNEVTKRLMAELDDNNYASFYEYDEDGSLVRIKKETEKGVFTIKEIRKSLKKE